MPPRGSPSPRSPTPPWPSFAPTASTASPCAQSPNVSRFGRRPSTTTSTTRPTFSTWWPVTRSTSSPATTLPTRAFSPSTNGSPSPEPARSSSAPSTPSIRAWLPSSKRKPPRTATNSRGPEPSSSEPRSRPSSASAYHSPTPDGFSKSRPAGASPPSSRNRPAAPTSSPTASTCSCTAYAPDCSSWQLLDRAQPQFGVLSTIDGGRYLDRRRRLPVGVAGQIRRPVPRVDDRPSARPTPGQLDPQRKRLGGQSRRIDHRTHRSTVTDARPITLIELAPLLDELASQVSSRRPAQRLRLLERNHHVVEHVEPIHRHRYTELLGRRQHNRRGLRIGPDVELRRRRRVADPGGTTHEHNLAQPGCRVRIGSQQQRDVRHRGERNQRDQLTARRRVTQYVAQQFDRVTGVGWPRRPRPVEIPETVDAVHMRCRPD